LRETMGDRESGRQLEERVIDIWRCACVVKGGRRFSFAAMAVVGDGNGMAGVGYGKAREVPAAIEKAVKDARKHMERFCIVNDTIPHETRGHFGSADVLLIPAMPGTGVIAGEAVRAVAESVGVKNLLSKSFGRNNAKNLVRATFNALRKLKSYEQIRELRGVDVEYRQTKAERVSAAASEGSPASAAAGPAAASGASETDEKPEGGRPGRGRQGGRRQRGPRGPRAESRSADAAGKAAAQDSASPAADSGSSPQGVPPAGRSDAETSKGGDKGK